jgi:hypothetical protein
MSKHNNEVLPSISEADYRVLLQLAVTEIRTARRLVAQQINSTTNSTYWNLGKLLSEKQLAEGYGSGVVNQLSRHGTFATQLVGHETLL